MPKGKRKPPAPGLLSAPDAARRAGRDVRTVRRWVRLGAVNGAELGGRVYVSSTALEALLAELGAGEREL